MKINENKYFLGALYIGIVGLGLSIFIFSLQTIDLLQNDSNKSPIVQLKTYINKKGEQWNLPVGKYKFTVAQAATNEGPVFLEGEIDPPDVHVGDTQWLRVIVQSPVGIKQVTAHIETDTGIKELSLNKVGTVSYRDMEPNKYLVENGILEILSTRQAKKLHNQKIATEKKSFFSKVSAQEGEKEKWENFWVVHDTHNTTYKTTFVVEDNAGLTNTLTLAWSDLCEIPINGDYNNSAWKLGDLSESNCTISPGQFDGIERGDIVINGGGTLSVSGTFVFNPGKKIDLTAKDGSKISIWENGQIRKTYMWYCDWDGDGYTPSGEIGTILTGLTDPISACGGGGSGGTGFNSLLKKVVKIFKPEPTLSAEICGKTDPVYTKRRHEYKGVSDGSLKDCSEDSFYAYPESTVFCTIGRNCDRFTEVCDGAENWDYNCNDGFETEINNIASCNMPPWTNSCAPGNGCYNNCNSFINQGWLNSIAGCGEEAEWGNRCSSAGANGICAQSGGNEYTCNVSPYNYNCVGASPESTINQTQGCR